MCRKRRAPSPDHNHISLRPHPKEKGSYYRRIDDIALGLKKVDAARLPSAGKFLFYYYACEKLAKGIIGIQARWPAEDAYEQGLDLARA